ncbi:MAG: hypothetical protein E6Q93_15295 [Burkholderiaceae bacterium]|nr:MAG: hypothetical protein E6Q93_15295 [Burkholderiaceae bacterium]
MSSGIAAAGACARVRVLPAREQAALRLQAEPPPWSACAPAVPPRVTRRAAAAKRRCRPAAPGARRASTPPGPAGRGDA